MSRVATAGSVNQGTFPVSVDAEPAVFVCLFRRKYMNMNVKQLKVVLISTFLFLVRISSDFECK